MGLVMQEGASRQLALLEEACSKLCFLWQIVLKTPKWLWKKFLSEKARLNKPLEWHQQACPLRQLKYIKVVWRLLCHATVLSSMWLGIKEKSIYLYFIKFVYTQDCNRGSFPLHLREGGEMHDSKLCNSSSVYILLASSAVSVAFLHFSGEKEKGIKGF